MTYFSSFKSNRASRSLGSLLYYSGQAVAGPHSGHPLHWISLLELFAEDIAFQGVRRSSVVSTKHVLFVPSDRILGQVCQAKQPRNWTLQTGSVSRSFETLQHS